jgi:hypothetical protein
LRGKPDLKIFLASDGTEAELAWFVQRYHPLRVINPVHAAVDLLGLSRCRAIIGSSSTFSDAAAAIGGIPNTWPLTEMACNKDVLARAFS